MPTYYLCTRPETITSIIKNGKLPERLPPWIKLDFLFCAPTPLASLTDQATSLHQTFILKLTVPAPDSKESKQDILLLKQISPEWVTSILVYSQQGSKLVEHILGKNYLKLLVVQPEAFSPIEEARGSKRAREPEKKEDGNEPAAKRVKIQEPLSYQSSLIKKDEQKLSGASVSRISTVEEHIQLLESAFHRAKKSLLITSYGINHETMVRANLYQLIPMACARGVKLYIYYNDQQMIDKRVLTFFKEQGIFHSEAYTHSKIVAVDKDFVATGSFNWLSGVSKNCPAGEEGSFVIQGKACEELIEEFWHYLKYYRHQQFSNNKWLDFYEEDPDHESSPVYALEQQSELGYLPTLDQHCGFLRECFEKARIRLIICSPFISSARGYEEDINLPLLKKTIARGVDIYFVCSSDSECLKPFRDFLAQLNSSKIHLLPTNNIHLKTIIVDEEMITEGSFNWLSAARDDRSDYHNHEQTLYVKGRLAGSLIEHFFKTRVGEMILKDMCMQAAPGKGDAKSTSSLSSSKFSGFKNVFNS